MAAAKNSDWSYEFRVGILGSLFSLLQDLPELSAKHISRSAGRTVKKKMHDAWVECSELHKEARNCGDSAAMDALRLAARCLMVFAGEEGIDPNSPAGREYLSRRSVRDEIDHAVWMLRAVHLVYLRSIDDESLKDLHGLRADFLIALMELGAWPGKPFITLPKLLQEAARRRGVGVYSLIGKAAKSTLEETRKTLVERKLCDTSRGSAGGCKLTLDGLIVARKLSLRNKEVRYYGEQ